jgi:hypothetical protein
MHALICETPDDDRPDNGVGEFDALFGSIVRSSSVGVVVYDEGGQAWDPSIHNDLGGADGLFDYDGFKHCPLGTIVPRSRFIELLRYVTGFWTDYWLFDSEVDVHCPTIDLSVDVVSSTKFPAQCTHMFCNVDGSYWVMFTERDDHIRTVEASWHRTRRLKATQIRG